MTLATKSKVICNLLGELTIVTKKPAGTACKHAQDGPCSLLISSTDNSCKFFYDTDYLVQSYMKFAWRAYNCKKKKAGSACKHAQGGPRSLLICNTDDIGYLVQFKIKIYNHTKSPCNYM